MESEEIPKKRRKSSDINSARCLICQEDISGKTVITFDVCDFVSQYFRLAKVSFLNVITVYYYSKFIFFSLFQTPRRNLWKNYSVV